MKRRMLIIFVVTLSMLVLASPAFAYDGIQVNLVDGNGDDWTLGGTFTVNYFDLGGSTIANCTTTTPSGNSPYYYNLTGCSGLAEGDPVWGSFDPNATNGNVAVVDFSFIQDATATDYIIDANTGTGPTAVEIVDFSVSQPAAQNAWLPYALLAGSVILVSGAITILRKRRA